MLLSLIYRLGKWGTERLNISAKAMYVFEPSLHKSKGVLSPIIEEHLQKDRKAWLPEVWTKAWECRGQGEMRAHLSLVFLLSWSMRVSLITEIYSFKGNICAGCRLCYAVKPLNNSEAALTTAAVHVRKQRLRGVTCTLQWPGSDGVGFESRSAYTSSSPCFRFWLKSF